MATISKEVVVNGYCEVDKCVVAIGIEYISFPRPEDQNGNRTFIKNSNQCEYLKDGRCSKGRKCEIYQNAELEFSEFVGRV